MAVVDTSSVGADVYTAIRTLVLANLPTYSRDIQGTSTTFTYNMVASYPKDNPVFPIVVVSDAEVDVVLLNLDGSGEDYGVTVQLDLYAKEAHGIKAVTEGKDSLRATFIGNLANFDTNNGMIPDEDFIDESNNAPFMDKNQTLNTSSLIFKFKLK